MSDEVVKVEPKPAKKGLCVGAPRGKRQSTIEREDRFVDEYLTCFCYTTAAGNIGLKGNLNRKGWELAHRPCVKKQIRLRMKALRKKCGMESVDVLMRLIRNEGIAFAAGDMTQSTRCLELMGKSIAMFTEKIAIDANVTLGPRRIILNSAHEIIDGKLVEQEQETIETKCLTKNGT